MQIENFRKLNADGPAVALFDVYWPEIGLRVSDVKLVRSRKGRLFPSFPSHCVVNELGEKTYVPYVTLSDALMGEFRCELEIVIRKHLNI